MTILKNLKNNMFTGIIEEIGTIKNIQIDGNRRQFEIQAKKVLSDLAVDQSVSINGVCLTVVRIQNDVFFVDAVSETIAKSTLGNLKMNDPVNLERALRLQDRLGGHLVQGHVDGIGKIRNLTIENKQATFVIEIPEALQKYAIPKGSIAIDGISLTIAEKKANLLTIAIIPHTLRHTVLQFKSPGDLVNIEVDFMAKYIEQFIHKSSETKLTTEWLKQQGF